MALCRRGKYYDTETGFYYLQSRYYDPIVRRFLNADSLASTGQGFLGTNMFAYCQSNPVTYSDPTGHAIWPCTVAINDGGCAYSYDTMDDAAIDAGRVLALRTQESNREYGCGIYYNESNGKYYVKNYLRGLHAEVSFAQIINDNGLVALVHSHPYCNGHIPNAFSKGDMQLSAFNSKVLYLAAPNGTLQKCYEEGRTADGFSMCICIVCNNLPIDTSKHRCRPNYIIPKEWKVL